MVSPNLRVTRRASALVVGIAFLCTCRAAIVDVPESQSALSTVSRNFGIWESCEDQWNEEKGVTEVCCKGNYKCSSDVCKDNTLCSFGFLANSLWCHNQSCEPKTKGEDSGEEDEDDKDKDAKGKGDKNKGDKNKGDKNKGDKNKGDKNKGDKNKGDKNKGDKNKGDKNKGDKNKGDKGKGDKNKGDKNKGDKDKGDENGDSKDDLQKESDDAEDVVPEVHASPSPAPASPPPSPPPNEVSSDDPLHCNGQRNRREIRDLSPEQRREWQNAILTLRSNVVNGESEWDRLVNTHMASNDEAHGGSYFLPWHRMFLLRLENALRRTHPNLAIPYWDWTIDAGDAAMSPVWNDDTVGGATRGNHPIRSGPFQGMDARYPQPHIVLRDFTSGVSGQMRPLLTMSAIQPLIDGHSWEDFTDGIEAAHALPHIYIGGDMSDAFRAPNDPVFYLHHAFVDYLYSRRQGVRGSGEFGGTHDFRVGTQPASGDRVMQAFGVPVSQAFDVGCVNYIPPSRVGRTMSGRGMRGSDDIDFCQDPSFASGKIISRERCMRGREALRGER